MTDQPPTREPAGNPAHGQPPYPPYAPYPPYQPYAYSRPVNTYAILALVFGATVFAPLGIYFGKKAKKQIAQTGERGVELATAGVVVGSICTAFYGLTLLVWCVVAVIVNSAVNG
jgi:hypothetical protein